MTENANLQSRMYRELAEAQQQLREKVSFFIQALQYHCFSDLQEEQMVNDAEIHSRLQQQLREKVSVEICVLF